MDVISFVDDADGGIALDANEMVEGLISVCRKHQNSIFRFINRVYSHDDSVFVEMVSWMTLFVNFIRDGKQGKHMLDIIGLVEQQARAGVISAEALEEELAKLNSWLTHRQETAKQELRGDAYGELAPATEYLDDVGLNWDDIGFAMAEVEVDDQEEFVPELTTDLGQDAVSRERFRRAKAHEMEQRKEQLQPRPESEQIQKLLPAFREILAQVLAKSHVEPTPMERFMPVSEKHADA